MHYIVTSWGTLFNDFIAKISGSEFKSCLQEGESRSRHEKSVLKWRLKAAKMQIGSRGLDNGCPAWTTSHTSSLSSSSSSSSSLPHYHHHLLLLIIITVIMQIGSQGLTSSCPAWSTTHPPTTILTQQRSHPGWFHFAPAICLNKTTCNNFKLKGWFCKTRFSRLISMWNWVSLWTLKIENSTNKTK